MLTILSILFVLLSALLVFVVVIQPSQGEGLASAFGGGGTESFFGTKAGQHINRFTIILSILFLLLAIGINKLSQSQKQESSSVVSGKLQAEKDIPPEQRQQPQAASGEQEGFPQGQPQQQEEQLQPNQQPEQPK